MNVLHPNKKAAIITLLTNGVSQRGIERKVRVAIKKLSSELWFQERVFDIYLWNIGNNC